MDREIHQQFVDYGRNAKEWLRKCALLLPEIDRQRIWKKKGFSSLFEYAAKLAGMSRTSVEESLRILKRVENSPILKKVVEEKGIYRVRPLLAVVTPETESFWAEKAITMSKNTLETYVRNYRSEIRPGTDSQPERSTLQMDLDTAVAGELKKLKGDGNWNTLMKELLEFRAKALEQEKPQPIQTSSRHIPQKVKRFVLNRTNGQCAYPGCTRPYQILHHTQRFALEKVHDPDRLMPMCKAHERVAHQGLIQNEEKSATQWSLRLNPDRTSPTYAIDQKVMTYYRGG